MVDVIIPTLLMDHAQDAFDSLKHLPFDYTLHKVTEGKCWPEAINIGLKRTNPENDVLIMDDDVRLHPDTFKHFERYYPHADIFGFKLLFGNGTIQHGGGVYLGNGCITHSHWSEADRELKPQYVCHVTASLMYIKRNVLDAINRMDRFSGQQFEDVDFNWRAIKQGFKILFIPNAATHLESGTKRDMEGFVAKQAISLRELMLKHFEYDLAFEQEIEKGYPREFRPF